MSISSLDIILQKFIGDGLDFIRQNPDVLNEIFAFYGEYPYEQEYGQRTILQIREWFLTNNIVPVLAWEIADQKFPMYSVQLAEANEQTETAFFGDTGGFVEEDIQPRVIVPQFVPFSYDATNFIITAPDDVDLSMARIGHNVKDAKGQVLSITYLNGQEITIDPGTYIPDMATALVQSFLDTKTYKRGETYLKETCHIGIHAPLQASMVTWMYSILIYIIMRFKYELEARCVDLSTWSASDLQQNVDKLPDRIFSRWVTITGRTRIDWKENIQPSVDTLIADVEVDET